MRLDLLPTPAVNDMGAAYTPETWDQWTAKMRAKHGNGNGHGDSLNIEAQRLLPTPSSQEPGYVGPLVDGDGKPVDHVMQRCYDPESGRLVQTGLVQALNHGVWGKYAAAIRRWEAVTRPAPEPTNITAGYLKMRLKRHARLDTRPAGMRGSLKVRRQLAAQFSEWMMGVPLGWITDVPGITRNEALKAAGNGVVPQQAAEALRYLLALPTGRQIADAHEPTDLLELLEGA